MVATAGTEVRSPIGLDAHGLGPSGRVYWNPTTSLLYSHALLRGEAQLAEGGPLVVDTGEHTGRSPLDKFLVREPGSEDRLWWGTVNQPIEEDRFEGLRARIVSFLDDQDVYVVDAFAGADPAHRLSLRVVTYSPWHALFAKTLFIDPPEKDLRRHEPEALVLHAPAVEADPEADGTRSATFVVLHPSRSEVLIGGTYYAGEIKKSIFTVMNDRLPLRDVMPMHCSANVGRDGRVAVFFGLSGTGKTTLSADPERHLIGDDEHGWSDDGIFNMEGGCYAKVIRLSAEAEPEIYRTTKAFGTVLENVVMDERGVLDLDDDSKTENTRAAYKLEQIANHLPTKRAGHPASVVMLTADAFGVLPPIARLTPRAGALLLPLRLHGQGGGHRDRHHGAPGHVLGVLRRPLPSAAPVHVRGAARRAARAPRLDGLARQHRLDGRPVRRGPADADRRDAGDVVSGPLGEARQRRISHGRRLRLPRARERARCRQAAARSALDVARAGGVRRAGREARADVCRQLREVRRCGGA